MQRQHDVRARLVGHRRPHQVVRGGCCRAGEQHRHSDGTEPAFDPACQVERHLGLGKAVGNSSGVIAAVAGIQYDDSSEQAMARGAHYLLLTQRVWGPSGYRPRQIREGTQGRRANAAVDSQSHPALESSNRMLGFGSQYPVDAVGGEPQRQKSLLKLGHIIALEHVARDVGQDPVAQLPTGPVQGDVCLWSEHSVNHQSPPLLKGADRVGHLLVVDI